MSYWDSSRTCPANVATLRGWQSSRVFQPKSVTAARFTKLLRMAQGLHQPLSAVSAVCGPQLGTCCRTSRSICQHATGKQCAAVRGACLQA